MKELEAGFVILQFLKRNGRGMVDNSHLEQAVTRVYFAIKFAEVNELKKPQTTHNEAAKTRCLQEPECLDIWQVTRAL